ncbi:MAG: dockerin type I domain-containing protein [Planctomycetota bacterium]
MPDQSDIEAETSDDANTNGIPDECEPAWIVAARSCRAHLAAEWCLEMGQSGARVPGDNIEPRFAGMHKLELDFNRLIDPGSLTVGAACVDNDLNSIPYNGSVTVTAGSGNTLALDFSEALPDETCCTISAGGSASGNRKVRSLVGDVNRDGQVSVSDKALIKPRIGRPLNAANFYFDVNCDGVIGHNDKVLVRPRIGNAAPSCP